MNELKVFENPAFGQVRTVTINDEPWFVGKDVAVALGYKESAKAVREHVDADDRGVSEMDTPGGKQKITIINESGLYSLILCDTVESVMNTVRNLCKSYERNGFRNGVRFGAAMAHVVERWSYAARKAD